MTISPPKVWYWTTVALIALISFFAIAYLGSDAKADHGPEVTPYTPPSISARHPDPTEVTHWLIFMGATPMVSQTPAWTIPVQPGLQPDEVQILRVTPKFNKETWVQIGITGPNGMALEPYPMLYPHRHPCAWYAARDNFPLLLGFPDLEFIPGPVEQEEFTSWLYRWKGWECL